MRASVDTLNLEKISESNRWLIANALRTAAQAYRADAEIVRDTPNTGDSMARQFEDQALVAEAFAEQFEDC